MIDTERKQFLDAIRERPDDDGLRLIYADYLAEHGQENRSDFIRVQIELQRNKRQTCECGGELLPLKRDFMPLMSACKTCRGDGPFWNDIQGFRCDGRPGYSRSPYCSDERCRLCSLMRHQDVLFMEVAKLDSGWPNGYPYNVRHYDRGLLTDVAMNSVEVLTKLDELLGWNPIRRAVVRGPLRYTTDRDDQIVLLAGDERLPRRCKTSALQINRLGAEYSRYAIGFTLSREWPGIEFVPQWGSSVPDHVLAALNSGLSIPPAWAREQFGLPAPE